MQAKLKLVLVASAVLAQSIEAIGKKRSEYDAAVQDAALQVIGQSWVHRNVTPAMALVKAVSKHDRPTLVAYLEKFGQMKWDTKAEGIAFLDRSKEFADDKAFEVFEEAMTAAKWYDAKKPPVVKSQYDAQLEIGNLLDRLLKKMAKGATIANKAILLDVHAAYCGSIAKHYGEKAEMPQGQQPVAANSAGVVQADRVNELAQQANARQVAEQTGKIDVEAAVAALAEHFGKPQVKAA